MAFFGCFFGSPGPRRRLTVLIALLATLGLLPGGSQAGKRRAQSVQEPDLTPADRQFWAFRPPRRPVLPAVRRTAWVRTPVDAFVLAQLEQAGLEPARAADRATLLRRVTFDLTGLPPTPNELDDFLHDHQPGAYERVVERLLASPHYGERWAQHWLDVVRYADSNGYEADGDRPDAWRYRDYVVQSLNDDKPYNRFLTEQLAGDLLARGQTPRQARDLLIATGFNRCGPVHLVSGNTDPDVNRQEVLTEMTTTVGAAVLGLSIQCARCHDHKFDPISQADYYRLQAFFAAAMPEEIDVSAPGERQRRARETAALEARIGRLRKQIEKLEKPYRTLLEQLKYATLEKKYRDAVAVDPKKRTPEQKKLAELAAPLLKVNWDEVLDALTPAERARRTEWRRQLHDLEARLPPPPAHAWAVQERRPIPTTHILKRGNPKQPGPVVDPAVPRVLRSGVATPDRLALARWLTQPDNPLTARVIVNRLWQHHFGRGLVATPNDFGRRGTRPSHPKLLDWLACELVSHNWSLKHLHRLMVLSNAYRQASRVAADHPGRRVDPDNRLLWHMNRRRLDGEALRDSVLAVAGTLNPEVGGPPVRVPLEPAVTELIFTEGEPDGVWLVTPDVRQHTRRSLYLLTKRNLHVPLLEAFDRPDTLTSCPVRPVSTFAPQAFVMLNGGVLQQQSKAFATRLMRLCGSDPSLTIDWAFQLALGRRPLPIERQLAKDFLVSQTVLLRQRLHQRQPVAVPDGLPPDADRAAAAALADFCLALLNRNEFVFAN
ncbi:MAG TPA: DUF1549 and DUF1553 domain-containing protein [Gemmataceae bacterium]|nr:DUF1549 and DUF1553 domain-containing protein [Gemmataceae bacterium]